MSKKTRRPLFYGLLLLFPLLSGAIVLYAQGWRLDWETFKVQKVGAIYVRSFPERVDIHLNSKPIKNKSGILDRGTFIGSLFPKNYTLTLSADGYRMWEEHITVKPSLVSEIKYGVLIPKFSNNVTTSSVENFWIVNREPLVLNSSGKLLWRGGKLLGNRAVAWTDDSSYIVTEDEKTKTYFLNDVSGGQPVSNPLGIKSPEIIQDPADGNGFIIRTGGSVFLFDPSKNNGLLSDRLATTTDIFAASPSWFAWTRFDQKKNVSHLILYDRSSKEQTDTVRLPGKTMKIAFRNDDTLQILQNDGGLYAFKAREDRADKTADSVKDFYVSLDKNLLAALENESIEIFSFAADKDYWRFRLPDNFIIRDLEWYRDGAHLFVVYPQEIRFLDLNDKALENFPAIASGSSAKYDEQSNKFYFVKDKELRSLTFPR